MILKFHHLKSTAGAKHRTKRVGRGNSSGHGTYSGRGGKGQTARKGGSHRLKQKGLRHLLLAMPKLRGFHSQYSKLVVVNLELLEKHFQDGDKITPSVLLEKGLIDTIKSGVKILGQGDLRKKLIMNGCAVSQSAKEKIEKAGGSVS